MVYKLTDLYEMFASLPSGGFLTDQSKLDRRYMYAMIGSLRAAAIPINYKQNKRLNSGWYQPFFPEFGIEWQSSCYGSFELPSYINANGVVGGVGYLGSIDFGNAFTFVETPQKFYAFTQNYAMRPRAKDTYVVVEGNRCRVYGNKSRVREWVIYGIWSDPLDIPTYNEATDPYPIDASLLQTMQHIFINGPIPVIVKTPAAQVQTGAIS